jgi:AbrB family looped-hinge helix DNA binding protein
MVNKSLETVTFSVKGQILIPRRFRKEFEIEEGTKAFVQSTPEGILLKPVTNRSIRALRGSLKKGVLKSMMEDRKKERDL